MARHGCRDRASQAAFDSEAMPERCRYARQVLNFLGEVARRLPADTKWLVWADLNVTIPGLVHEYMSALDAARRINRAPYAAERHEKKNPPGLDTERGEVQGEWGQYATGPE